MNTEKKCTYCLQEIDFKKHGLTKYCSVLCRNKDYYKKNKLKIENYSKDETEIKSSTKEEKGSDQRNFRSNTNEIIFGNERGENRAPNTSTSEFSGGANNLTRYYDAKVEATRYELKCEYLENRIKELEQDIMHLESELENFNSEDNDNQNNFIGGLVSAFKSDPLNTIEFGSAMIQKLFSKKETKAPPNQP